METLRRHSPHTLRTFRHSFYYQCLNPRADALFELTDALLTAGAVPSLAQLSLEPAHRRGWGSLYAALDRGQINVEALKGLLARYPLAQGGQEAPLYAVDVSLWPRCDAQSSPKRGYYYQPLRHSAGKPIVAGWAYQFIARVNFLCESWSAPVDVQRIPPTEDANELACEQVKGLLARLPKEETAAVPLFVFDAGFRPRKIATGTERSSARRSWCGCGRGAASTPIRRPRPLPDAPLATGQR